MSEQATIDDYGGFARHLLDQVERHYTVSNIDGLTYWAFAVTAAVVLKRARLLRRDGSLASVGQRKARVLSTAMGMQLLHYVEQRHQAAMNRTEQMQLLSNFSGYLETACAAVGDREFDREVELDRVGAALERVGLDENFDAGDGGAAVVMTDQALAFFVWQRREPVTYLEIAVPSETG